MESKVFAPGKLNNLYPLSVCTPDFDRECIVKAKLIAELPHGYRQRDLIIGHDGKLCRLTVALPVKQIDAPWDPNEKLGQFLWDHCGRIWHNGYWQLVNSPYDI